MKSEQSVKQSYAGAVRNARGNLHVITALLPNTADAPPMHPSDIAQLRIEAERLLQRVHEISTYRNVLETV